MGIFFMFWDQNSGSLHQREEYFSYTQNGNKTAAGLIAFYILKFQDFPGAFPGLFNIFHNLNLAFCFPKR